MALRSSGYDRPASAQPMPILLCIPATRMPQSFWPLFSSRYQTVPWWPSHLITTLFGSSQFRVSSCVWRTVVQCSMMVGVRCMTWGPAWEAGGVGERSYWSGPKWPWCELGQYPWISGIWCLSECLRTVPGLHLAGVVQEPHISLPTGEPQILKFDLYSQILKQIHNLFEITSSSVCLPSQTVSGLGS